MTAVQRIAHSLHTAWPHAVSLAATLSQPRADVEASDEAVVALWRQSTIARVTDAAARSIDAAWTDSRARSAFAGAAGALGAPSREQAVRTISCMAATASALVLLLDAVRPTSLGPLTWVLPALWGAASLTAYVAAASLARLLGERRP